MSRSLTLFSLLLIAGLSGWRTGFCGPFSETEKALRLTTERWELTLDRENGALQELRDKSAGGTDALARGSGPLWSIERRNAEPLLADHYSTGNAERRFSFEWLEKEGRLRLEWTGPEAEVALECEPAAGGPVWNAKVRMKQGTLLGWAFPAAVEFDAEKLETFYFPDNIGIGFRRGFFQPGGGGTGAHAIGGRGMERLLGDRCEMRPVDDERVALRAGRDADGWLPEWYRREMKDWRTRVNRSPAGGKSDLELVASAHGPWLSGYRLGGEEGMLFRFGGMIDDGAYRMQFASVAATLFRLATDKGWKKETAPAIAVLEPAGTGRPGVRVSDGGGRWARELEALPPFREAGVRAVVIRDLAGLRDVFRRPEQWFAVIHLGGEQFPAAAEDRWQETLDGVGDYVKSGGIWWEAGGGYSFYKAVVPVRDASFTSEGRHFCDFAALESEAGSWACFGVQSPDGIYVSPAMSVASSGPDGARIGRFEHRYQWYLDEGKEWTPPALHMPVGMPAPEALKRYAAANGHTRGLAEKVKPETLEKLRRSVLLKFTNGTLKEQAERVRDLPAPMLVHISNYLKGGFDQQYPDHLPPNPEAGTGEDLRRLIDACHENGHLFSPYTNPTWWCTEPKGPTFERAGDAPLSRDLDGNLLTEQYGSVPHRGFTVSAWHPAVREANDVVRRQFTEEYPVDVLFQDQVGARHNLFDTNPAAPNPAAYLEGIHRIARVDSETVPLGTEDGHDRLINYEAMFCGLSWPWLPNRALGNRILYEHRWPRESWRVEPLALRLAHDKALFYHHDLGGFVRDRLDLATSLAFGYSMSYGVRGDRALDERDRDWIDLLHRIQTSVCARYAGRPLDEFEYLERDVIRARWGDLEIWANLAGGPYEAGDGVTLGGEGFHARAPGLEAGFFKQWKERKFEGEGSWMVREQAEGEEWKEWTRDAD